VVKQKLDFRSNPDPTRASSFPAADAKETELLVDSGQRPTSASIVHRTKDSSLCYVDHHDPATHWAEPGASEVHPQRVAAQFVEVRSASRRS